MKYLLLLVLLPLTVSAQSIQQLLPNGNFTFEIPNKEISMLMDTAINLPGMQKATSVVNGKKITVERFDRGPGYKITVTVGYKIIYNCSVGDRNREEETRYCY